MNIILLIGGILGLSSIMMAAYIDHGLALYFSGKTLNSVLTAVRYHQLYAIVVSMIGLALPMQLNHRYKSWLMRAAFLFMSGVMLFSGSIYASVILIVPYVNYLTPTGGIILMLGWVALTFAAIVCRFK